MDRIPLPPEPVIASAMHSYSLANGGEIPDIKSKGHEPVNGLGWSRIIVRVSEELGLTPFDLMAKHGYEAPKKKTGKKTDPLPANAVIAAAMEAYRSDPENGGRLPAPCSKGHEPCDLSWSRIITRLKKERNLTPTGLMNKFAYDGKKTKETLPLPSNDLIAQAMDAYRKNKDNKGKLPSPTSKGHEPEGCGLQWGRIIFRLKGERGLTPAKLMRDYDARIKKSDSSPRTAKRRKLTSCDDDDDYCPPAKHIFNAIVRYVKKHKNLPLSPNDELGVMKVRELSKLFQRGEVDKLEGVVDLSSHSGAPMLYRGFLLSSGLAVRAENNALVPANPMPALM